MVPKIGCFYITGSSDCAAVLSAGQYTFLVTSSFGYQGVFGIRIESLENIYPAEPVSGYFYTPTSSEYGQSGCTSSVNDTWNSVRSNNSQSILTLL